jgi:hypothetical protein
MSQTGRNTPPVKDYGAGGSGGVSNTSYPDVTEYDDTPPAGELGYGLDQAATEAEAAEAMREFDKGAP